MPLNHNNASNQPKTVTDLWLPQTLDPSLSLKVEDIVAWSPVMNNDFHEKYIIVSETKGVSIHINLNEISSDLHRFQLQLWVYIDALYKDWMYLEWLDRQLLECILYGTLDDLQSKINPDNNWVRIGTFIKKMTDAQIRWFDRMYGGKIQMKDPMVATFLPHPFDFIKQQFWENYMNHELFILKSEIFHAYFWQFGIKYYGNSTFLSDINKQWRDSLDAILANTKWVIATGKNITETRHDKRIDYEVLESERKSNNSTRPNIFPPLALRRRPVLIDGKVAPGWEVECIFPKVSKDQCILEIEIWELWKIGTNVLWNSLPCVEVKSIAVADLFDSTYTDFTNIDTSNPKKISFFAKENVFITIDKGGKLWFSKHKKFIWNIWPKTGSIVLPKDGTVFELKWEIQEGYSIKGYDIIYAGQLFWEIYAQNTVTVRWWGIVWWTITAEKGNISIDRNVRIQDHTRLEALDGKVIINWDINGATVIGEDIEVTWIATHCIFIGWYVRLQQNNGSKVMAEKFSVTTDKTWDSEYTILMYAGIQGLINSLQQKIKETEWKWILEESRIKTLWKWLDWDQILTWWMIHPDSRLQFLVVPFVMDNSLQELLGLDMTVDIMNARKKEWLDTIIISDKKNEWVVCSHWDLPFTRSQAIETLTSRLSDRLNHWVCREERNRLYPRWLRLPVSIGQLKGYFFDHSDSGWSCIFENYKDENIWTISVWSTVSIALSTKVFVSILVTRIEKRSIKDKNFLFIAGRYITAGIGPAITRTISLLETSQRRSN
jgi:hypothetical protein